jgi:hypothetical protein
MCFEHGINSAPVQRPKVLAPLRGILLPGKENRIRIYRGSMWSWCPAICVERVGEAKVEDLRDHLPYRQQVAV